MPAAPDFQLPGRLLDNYHRQMGRDRRSARPLPETLRSLGLDQAAKDLWGAKEHPGILRSAE